MIKYMQIPGFIRVGEINPHLYQWIEWVRAFKL